MRRECEVATLRNDAGRLCGPRGADLPPGGGGYLAVAVTRGAEAVAGGSLSSSHPAANLLAYTIVLERVQTPRTAARFLAVTRRSFVLQRATGCKGEGGGWRCFTGPAKTCQRSGIEGASWRGGARGGAVGPRRRGVKTPAGRARPSRVTRRRAVVGVSPRGHCGRHGARERRVKSALWYWRRCRVQWPRNFSLACEANGGVKHATLRARGTFSDAYHHKFPARRGSPQRR